MWGRETVEDMSYASEHLGCCPSFQFSVVVTFYSALPSRCPYSSALWLLLMLCFWCRLWLVFFWQAKHILISTTASLQSTQKSTCIRFLQTCLCMRDGILMIKAGYKVVFLNLPLTCEGVLLSQVSFLVMRSRSDKRASSGYIYWRFERAMVCIMYRILLHPYDLRFITCPKLWKKSVLLNSPQTKTKFLTKFI